MSLLHCRITSGLHSLSWAFFLLVLWLSPLTANAVNLTGLSLAPQNPMLNISDSLQLIATGSYDDGTQQVIAQAKQVSAGSGHTCAANVNGTIKCWGTSYLGAFGDGTFNSSSTPVTVTGISNAVFVSAGTFYNTCAVLADGTVWCWGDNTGGKNGNDNRPYSLTPIVVNGVSNAVSVSAGYSQTCALIADGTLRCWGGGMLGDGTPNSSPTPVTVSGISTATSVSVGSSHICTTLADGTVWCWGNNNAGQLGNGTSGSGNYFLTPVTVKNIRTATSVSAGSDHACATLADGTVRCWGNNNVGQLGNGTTTSSSTPVTVSGISTAVSVSAGGLSSDFGASSQHSCAKLADGTLRCWGDNTYGQLGNGTTTRSSIPVTVSGISTAAFVSVGRNHSCATLADGTLRCWGENSGGQLGDSTTALTPIVSDIGNAVSVSAGYDQTCATLTGGSVRCWGSNIYGQLGDSTSSIAPVVSGVSNAVSISTHYQHTCATLVDGTVRCWGTNDYGELGNGTTTSSSTPVTVSGISNAVAVRVGNHHSCAVLADGTLRCWGYGYGYAYGTNSDHSSIPVIIGGIYNAVSVSSGNDHSCAVLADGTLRCWGYNTYGQLGNGTTNSSTQVAVSGISNAVSVSAGYGHAYTCATLADGTVRCWGNNAYGQLGNGTTSFYYDNPTPIPVTVSGISNAISVSSGGKHACALLAGGALRCWGNNSYGQLGDGTTTRSLIPVAVSGISNAVSVTTGYEHTCATLTDGTLRCWGNNSFGQLGKSFGPIETLGYLSLAWNSLNPTVASVNGVGMIHALASGETQITVSANGYSASTPITVLGQPPVASDLNAIAVMGVSTNWTPLVSDPDGDPVTCRLGTPPANGSATVAADCSSGTYQSEPGFIGIDSFTYIANDGQYDSNSATVTVAVIDDEHSTACTRQYPVSPFTQTGKEGTLTITFTGNITSHTDKAVKLCPGTTLKYQTTSTKGPVVCKVKNNTTRGSGSLKINDHIKCTDKPAGKDKVHFKVKSGVK